MTIHELGHIVLYVGDIETSRRFYGDVLGWKQIPAKASGIAAFSSGRTHHELLLIEGGPNAHPPPRGPRLGMYHFGLKVGESDDELRKVLARGPLEFRSGEVTTATLDANGNLLMPGRLRDPKRQVSTWMPTPRRRIPTMSARRPHNEPLLPKDQRPMPRFTATDGTDLAYQDEGEGKPLVFVHGWMMSGRFWKRQVEAFRHQNRIIVPDLRGCGDSQPKPGTHNVPRYADDLHELFTRLELNEATLVGWSMGGGIAMEYLHRHGTARVKAVGLVDFPPKLEEDPSVADKVCHNLNTRKDSFSESFLQRMFLEPLPPSEKSWMLAEANKCSPTSACEMYRAMRGPGEVASRKPYAIPALLAFPEKGWFPKALAEWTPHFSKTITPAFPKSKHCPFLEEPEAFNSALRTTMSTR